MRPKHTGASWRENVRVNALKTVVEVAARLQHTMVQKPPELAGISLVSRRSFECNGAFGKMIAVTRSLAHEGHMHSNDVSSLDGKAVVPVSAGWLIRRAALWMLLVVRRGGAALYVAAAK